MRRTTMKNRTQQNTILVQKIKEYIRENELIEVRIFAQRTNRNINNRFIM